MPFNGSGSFSLIFNWQQDALNNINISSSRMMGQENDIAAGLSLCLTKDGQQTPTANIPMGGFRFTNMGNATAQGNAVSVQDVQNGSVTTLTSVTGTDTITANTAPSIGSYAAGQSFDIPTAGPNTTTAVTLNINGLGAKNVVRYGGSPLAIGDMQGTMRVRYDGTQFYVMSSIMQTAIQNISASVAANALTVIFNPSGPVHFRNPTLSNGAPVVAPITAPLSITVPSGASLGTTSGIASTLVALLAYNSGTPVLCIVNLAGGASLDENGVISPTTISGSSNAGIIYSASAVAAGSPYRVVGVVQITEATAGTWSVGPTNVQGVGGEAFSSLQSFGVGQTVQNVTGSRSTGTTFYNTTGRTIWVAVLFGGASAINARVQAVVNGIVFGFGDGAASAGGAFGVQFPVPPGGAAYSVGFQSGSGTLSSWFEIR